MNGDGFDDIMVGAQLGDPIGTDAGETYVVFGGEYGVKGWANSNSTSRDLNTLNGSNGFRLNGDRKSGG